MKDNKTFNIKKCYDHVHLILGLYADDLFAQFGYDLLCKALSKHKLRTVDSLMTNCQFPVSSSQVTLKVHEQQPHRLWNSYKLNS